MLAFHQTGYSIENYDILMKRKERLPGCIYPTKLFFSRQTIKVIFQINETDTVNNRIKIRSILKHSQNNRRKLCYMGNKKYKKNFKKNK